MTENVASLCSVKAATPPCAAKATIPVDLPSASDFIKPFAASKLELCVENNPPYDCNHTEDSLFYEHRPMPRLFCLPKNWCRQRQRASFGFPLRGKQSTQRRMRSPSSALLPQGAPTHTKRISISIGVQVMTKPCVGLLPAALERFENLTTASPSQDRP